MQYWKTSINGKIERLEDEEIEKHPERIDFLQDQGYIRIKSESDHSIYSVAKKSKPKKKKKLKK